MKRLLISFSGVIALAALACQSTLMSSDDVLPGKSMAYVDLETVVAAQCTTVPPGKCEGATCTGETGEQNCNPPGGVCQAGVKCGQCTGNTNVCGANNPEDPTVCCTIQAGTCCTIPNRKCTARAGSCECEDAAGGVATSSGTRHNC